MNNAEFVNNFPWWMLMTCSNILQTEVCFIFVRNITLSNWVCMTALIRFFLATCLIFGVISETLGTNLMPILGLAIPQNKSLIKRGPTEKLLKRSHSQPLYQHALPLA